MNEGMQNLKEIQDLEDKLTETKKLKKMLSQGWKEIRASKNKTWPRFGIEMFLLQCIIQCNKALNEKEKNENK